MNDEEVGKIVAGLFILFFGLAIGLITFTTPHKALGNGTVKAEPQYKRTVKGRSSVPQRALPINSQVYLSQRHSYPPALFGVPT